VRSSHLRVDDTHGDAYTVWVAQGSPQNPSSAQLAALEQAMTPSALVPDGVLAVAADGAVAVDFDLPRFGLSLLTFRPMPDGSEPVGHDGGTSAPVTAGGGCACNLVGRARNAGAPALLLAWALLDRRRRRRRGYGPAN
jgi:hypothetical protein